MAPTPADSSGIPWTGRSIGSTGFEGDTGAADPALMAALTARAATPSSAADAVLMRAAAAARWLVPVVAVPGEVEAGRDGMARDGMVMEEDTDQNVEKSTEMAVVTLTAADGRRALPVFTAVAALARWDATARPVPVSAARAATAAIAEGCQVMLVDVAGPEPTELRPSMVWALAQRQPWVPAHQDPFVARSVEAAVRDVTVVTGHRVEEGPPAGCGVLRVVLALRPGLDAAQVQQVAGSVAERLATDGEFRARVDELTFSIVPSA